MSGDHNMHQKPRSYLDDFECPRCGHCCKSDLAGVGEVGVWGEWQELTDEEIQDLGYLAEKFDASNSEFFDRWGFARAIEAKLKERNT